MEYTLEEVSFILPVILVYLIQSSLSMWEIMRPISIVDHNSLRLLMSEKLSPAMSQDVIADFKRRAFILHELDGVLDLRDGVTEVFLHLVGPEDTRVGDDNAREKLLVDLTDEGEFYRGDSPRFSYFQHRLQDVYALSCRCGRRGYRPDEGRTFEDHIVNAVGGSCGIGQRGVLEDRDDLSLAQPVEVELDLEED